MFKRFNVKIISNPTCSKSLKDIDTLDFKYYDKDGFELNKAEQQYYQLMNYPLGHAILNHVCWQEPWFELEKNNNDLILDHSMVLHRANYEGRAAEQLLKIKKEIPEADLLLKTKQKWGFDFALDAISPDNEVYEVLHIEYDNLNYDIFNNQMIVFDYTVRHTDWHDAAKKILKNKDKWAHLTGFEQNHWKSNFLIGWKRSEYTEKSLTF